MAKRVKTTTVKEELPENPIENSEPIGIDISGDGANLGRILQRFNEPTLTVEVYKDESGHMEYCETIRGTWQVDKDSIRDTWGGGKFELRVYDSDELVETITFRIAKKPLTSSIPQTNIEAQMLREQNNFFQQMVLRLMSPGVKTSSSDISMRDILDLVMKMNSPTSPEKTLDVLMKGMELAKGNGSSGDWKSEGIHAIKDIAKTVIPSVVQGAAYVQAAQKNGNGNGHMQHTPQPNPPFVFSIKDVIKELKSKALKIPSDLVLDWIIGNSSEYEETIRNFLQMPFEQFQELDSDLKTEPYLSWFKSLHEGLKNAYANNQNDADSDGDTGDMGNT